MLGSYFLDHNLRPPAAESKLLAERLEIVLQGCTCAQFTIIILLVLAVHLRVTETCSDWMTCMQSLGSPSSTTCSPTILRLFNLLLTQMTVNLPGQAAVTNATSACHRRDSFPKSSSSRSGPGCSYCSHYCCQGCMRCRHSSTMPALPCAQ